MKATVTADGCWHHLLHTSVFTVMKGMQEYKNMETECYMQWYASKGCFSLPAITIANLHVVHYQA